MANGKKSETTAVVVRSVEYPVLAAGAKVGDLMKANLGSADFSAFDLERVKMPGAGGISWTIETLEGEKSFDTLTGIIVLFQDCRAYWREAFSGETPPNCSSEDSRTGTGDPGGVCAKCPNAQFGTSVNSKGEPGRGQACKTVRRIFLLRPKTYLPTLISLPPTSIKNCRQYLTRVTNAGLPYWSVITEVALEKTKSGDGIAYSKATFKAQVKDGQVISLSAEESEQVRTLGAALKDVLKAKSFTSTEFVVPGDASEPA